MKLTDRNTLTASEAAARLFEIAKGCRIDKGRISVGEWNWAFLQSGGTVPEYSAGRDKLIADGVIQMHECGGFILPSEAVVADWDGGRRDDRSLEYAQSWM